MSTDGPELPAGGGPAGPADPAPPSDGGPAGPADPELPLAGLDAERPLPAELRARLESALLAAVAGGLPVPADEDTLDAPRPLPEAVRARLEAALLAEAAPVAAGVVTSLEERRKKKVVAAWSAVAAVLLMVVAVAGLVSRGHQGSQNLAAGGPTTTTAGPPVSVPSGTGGSSEITSPASTAPVAGTATAAPGTTRATAPARPTPSTTGVPAAPGAQTGGPPTPGSTTPPSPATTTPVNPGASQPATSDPGPAPPFYNSGGGTSAPTMAAQPAPSGGAAPNQGSQDAPPQKSTAPTASGPRLRVGVVTGDKPQEDAFRAYIDRLNQSGGVRGHLIDLVPVSTGSPADRSLLATVNLSAQPVAGPGGPPSWASVTGPLLETLTATENLLTGNGAVFSFASPPERQGHLAADALFPAAVTSKPAPTAVIYAGASTPLSDAVPAAMKAVLEARGVKVSIVTYDPAHGKTGLVNGADAALLSLDPAGAKAWVAQAKTAHYRPALGIAGIYSLADDALASDLPDGTRVISPYSAPSGDEGQAIGSIGDGTSAPVLHGWVTAKALAAAIYRTGADTPAELQSALEGLAGSGSTPAWSPGLAPAYETRPGTRARTPEGVLFQVQSGAYIAQGSFRRDSF